MKVGLLATSPALGEWECRSFDYLRCEVVPEIFGIFDTDFWTPMLQLRETEPALQHALLSLSTVYEYYRRDSRQKSSHHTFDPESPPGAGTSTSPLSPFAIQQYNKAIQLLIKDERTSESPSLDVTLMACLIFVCLEFLRNNFRVGLKHLKSGLKILDSHIQYLNDTPNVRHAIQRRPFDQALRDFYTRLDIQATVHGSATSDFNSTAIEHWRSVSWLPHSFSSVSDAQTKLGEELCAIFQFIRHRHDDSYYGGNSQCTSPAISDDIASYHSYWPSRATLNENRRHVHLRNLKHWREAFISLAGPDAVSMDRVEHHRHNIPLLFLYHDLAVLQLTALTFKSEMEYDAFRPDFEHMVANAWRVLQEFDAIGSQPPVISFDIGLLAPLFFIVLKCRHLKTRRRAIGLMRLAPEREGMWVRDPIIEYSEWKLEQEEAGRGGLDEDSVLPEESRIFGETISQAVVNGEKVRVLRFYKGSPDAMGVYKCEEIVTNRSLNMGDFI